MAEVTARISSVRLTVNVVGVGEREGEWTPDPNGPHSAELHNLNAAFEVGEWAKGMVADIVGGMAEFTFRSPASRTARPKVRHRGLDRT